VLALSLTFVFALYILGPDAFSRFILDFSVPRRSVTLTKSEEVYRAVTWGGVALAGAYFWERWSGCISRVWSWGELRTFFAGINSEQFFRENQDKWFESLHAVAWMNFCLLWRLYAVVLILSVILCISIHYYATIRHFLAGDSLHLRISRSVLAAIILPRIAPWHLLLSRIYVREKDVQIHLDVLTKMDILYQGRFEAKSLAADGTLVSLTLGEPKRFRREEYSDEKAKGTKPDAATFWKAIPNNIFVLMGSDIHSINIRYVPIVAALKRRPRSSDLAEQLEALRKAVEQLKASQPNLTVGLGEKQLGNAASQMPPKGRTRS